MWYYKMSLLITSSSSKSQTNAIGIEDPAAFTNHLKGTLTIPEDSEVAVQSVKIQRNPEVDYSGGRLTNFWFGERLSQTAELKDSVCGFIPQVNRIEQSLPIQEFTEAFSDMMAEALALHPEIATSASSASFCTPSYDTNGKFLGYKFQIAQVGTAPASVVPSDTTFVSLGGVEGLEGRATYTGGTMAAVDDVALGTFKLEGTEGPLSLYGGDLTFDVSQSNASDWTVGLARSVDLSASEAYIDTYLDYNFEPTDGIGPSGETFYEYCAQSAAGFIKLFQCVPDSGGGNQIVMREIKYYQKNNSSFAANNASNSSFATGSPLPSASVTSITFNLENEVLTVTDQNASVICKPTLVNASTKAQVPKPNCQNGWKLYPQIDLWDEEDEVSITKYQGRTNATMKDNYYRNDWPSHCTTDVTDDAGRLYPMWTGMRAYPEELDLRDIFRYYEGVDEIPGLATDGGTIHTYKGLDNNVMAGYENLLIMGQSQRYMALKPNTQSWQPNSADILGFAPSAIGPKVTGIVAAFGASFAAPGLPSTSADSSLFIRTPRLDIQTYNAATGNPSKILYSLPRFDNTGSESGALFFEASERLYVDCNNSQPLHITDFKVDMVKKDETKATDLTGATEIIFHFRKKHHKM